VTVTVSVTVTVTLVSVTATFCNTGKRSFFQSQDLPELSARVDTLTWSQNGVQQSRDVRQPIGIATSRVAQLGQLLFI